MSLVLSACGRTKSYRRIFCCKLPARGGQNQALIFKQRVIEIINDFSSLYGFKRIF